MHGIALAMLILPKHEIPAHSSEYAIMPTVASTCEPGSNVKNKKMGGDPLSAAQAYRLYALILKGELPGNHQDAIPRGLRGLDAKSASTIDAINFNSYVPFCNPGKAWDEKTYINVMLYALQKNDLVGLAWAQEFFKNEGTIIQQIKCPDHVLRPLQDALDMTTLSHEVLMWLGELKVDVKQVGKGAQADNIFKRKRTYFTPKYTIAAVAIVASMVIIKKVYDWYYSVQANDEADEVQAKQDSDQNNQAEPISIA